MMSDIPCKHWSDCGVSGGGCCAKGLHGGKPSVGVCLSVCMEYDGPSRGAGDLLAKAIGVVTFGKVKPCGGCKARQAALNAAMPFRVGADVSPGGGSDTPESGLAGEGRSV